ncbi:hypothetical protein PHPALM_31092 [Phytophthora palmivora]|uniref:Uncharacterized protein n=1 Tax=Phytophthora palmivora TaxID=4796 RepID=A0A2P4X3G4_9STRA|nr:hypothetical protein PHPALM_31092 [Phytophthora palmivora]
MLKTLLNEHRKLVKLTEITHKVKVENYHVNLVPGSTKAPKYDEDGDFDLFKARLESYLRQRDCWNVGIGDEAPDAVNADLNLFEPVPNCMGQDLKKEDTWIDILKNWKTTNASWRI